jgi:hypothetical protein
VFAVRSVTSEAGGDGNLQTARAWESAACGSALHAAAALCSAPPARQPEFAAAAGYKTHACGADGSAPLRLHLHFPHAATRNALHHAASDTPGRPVTHKYIARRSGQPPACRRHPAEHGAHWHTRSTDVVHAVEGRQRLLPEALGACCLPAPPKEPRCSSHELQRARDLRQRRLLVGQQRDVDVGERLGCAGEVICEQNARGRGALAVFFSTFFACVGVGHRKRLWERFWLKGRRDAET